MASAVAMQVGVGEARVTETRPEAARIAALVAGDERAWRALYVGHCDEVFRLARRFVHSDAEAEEVLQEVFVAAYRYIGRFRGQSKLRTWLYRITVNRALKRRRWWTRRREVGADALLGRSTRDIGADVRTRDREHLALVESCLERLDIKKRTVLVLHEIEGLDTKEIADVLQCPRSTVLTRLSRARTELVRMAKKAGVELEGS